MITSESIEHDQGETGRVAMPGATGSRIVGMTLGSSRNLDSPLPVHDCDVNGTPTGHIQGRLALLERLRAPYPPPPPTVPARPAELDEIPPSARALIRACRAPWTATATLAVGPIPYTWEHRHGGHMLAASCVVRVHCEDGRAAYVMWTRDKRPTKRDVGELKWQPAGGARWTICRCARRPAGHPHDVPVPIGVTELKAAILADLAARESVNTDVLTESEAA